MTDTASSTAGWDPEVPTPRRRGRLLVLVVVLAVLVALGGAVAFALDRFSGGGAQPESALPASTIAMVKIDLDPAAGQKLAAYRLGRRFPHSGVGTDPDAAVGDLVRGATGRTDSGIDFDRDIKPWLGRRAALAAVATGVDADPVATVAAVAFTDQAAMVAGLERVRARGGATGSLAYRYRDGYVLIGTDQAEVDAAFTAAGTRPLAGTVSSDVAALGGDQIGVAWADLGAVYRAIPAADRAEAAKTLGGKPLAGRYVVGLHVTDSSVELRGRGFDLQVPAGYASLGTAPTGGALVTDLPADGVSAQSVTGLGASVKALWNALPGDETGDGEDGLFGDLGIDVPDDLVGLFGSQTAVWVGHDGRTGGLRARTPDGAVAARTATKLLTSLRSQDSASGDDATGDEATTDAELAAEDPLTTAVVVRPAGGTDVVIATDRTTADAMTAPAHRLGDRSGFAAAAPDAATAGAVAWADLGRLVALAGDDTLPVDRADLAPLDQVGFTATAGGDWQFRLRVTVH